MRCPECGRQYSRFAVAPDAFWPNDELDCPHCEAGLRVGWWPAAGIAALTLVTVAAVGAIFWFGIADWVVRELGVPQWRILRRLVRVAVGTAMVAAIFGPGMYAIWVIGWYTRRPTTKGLKHGEPNAASDDRAKL